MSTPNPFPKLDLRALRIRDQLELVSDKSILGFSIRLALDNNRPSGVIFKTILDAYEDCKEGTLDVVSQEIIDSIKSLCHS